MRIYLQMSCKKKSKRLMKFLKIKNRNLQKRNQQKKVKWLFKRKLLRLSHLFLTLLRSMVTMKHLLIALLLINIIKKTRKTKKSTIKILKITHLIRRLMKTNCLLKKLNQILVKKQKLKVIKILHPKSRKKIIIILIRRIKIMFSRRRKRRL